MTSFDPRPVVALGDINLEFPACNFCEGEDFHSVRSCEPDRLLGRPGDWSVVRCVRCGLVQTRPRPDRASITEVYSDTYETTLAFAGDHVRSRGRGALAHLRDAPFRLRYGEQRAQQPLPDRRELLEVGCAAGVNLAQYAAAGWKVAAIEPSSELASIAAKRASIPPECIQTVPAEDAEFGDGQFDLIVMFHVLEHLHDPLRVLRSARRWLRVGGELQIGCPNYGSLERRLFGRFWIGLDLPRHLYHYTPTTLTAMLHLAGFEVTSIVPENEHVTTTLSVSAALDGLRRKRRPLPSSRFIQVALLPYTVLSRTLGAKPCMLATARLR